MIIGAGVNYMWYDTDTGAILESIDNANVWAEIYTGICKEVALKSDLDVAFRLGALSSKATEIYQCRMAQISNQSNDYSRKMVEFADTTELELFGFAYSVNLMLILIDDFIHLHYVKIKANNELDL